MTNPNRRQFFVVPVGQIGFDAGHRGQIQMIEYSHPATSPPKKIGDAQRRMAFFRTIGDSSPTQGIHPPVEIVRRH